MVERTWFYLVGRESVGPVAEQVVRQLAGAGYLHEESLVWTEGLAAWIPLGDADGMEGVAVPAPEGWAALPPDEAGSLSLPIGPSRWSAAAGYLGWLSVLVLPAPLALAAGVRAIREIRRSEGRVGRRVGGTGPAVFGILMGSVFTLVLVWVIAAAALR